MRDHVDFFFSSKDSNEETQPLVFFSNLLPKAKVAKGP